MWLSKRKTLMLIAAAALTGCGFSPVYAPGGSGNSLWGQVDPRPATTRIEQLFTRAVEDQFGNPNAAAYRLDYNIGLGEQGVALTKSNATTRSQIVGTVTYNLVRTTDGVSIAQGSVDNFTAYSTTGTTVANSAAQADAQERLVGLLAKQMSGKLFAAQLDQPE